MVYHALTTLDYGKTEVLVRVNALSTPFGRDDYEAIVRARPDGIRMPKTETAQDVAEADALMTRIEREAGIEPGSVKLFAAIESAKGVLNAQQIASSSSRLIGIALGAEDFVTDLKTTRSPDGIELLTARSMILFAARAARIDAVDTVFSNINDEEGFAAEVKLIKQLGFDGKSIINPRQIEIVHKIYTPTPEETEKAVKNRGGKRRSGQERIGRRQPER